MTECIKNLLYPIESLKISNENAHNEAKHFIHSHNLR
jgi:hypothetical protein